MPCVYCGHPDHMTKKCNYLIEDLRGGKVEGWKVGLGRAVSADAC